MKKLLSAFALLFIGISAFAQSTEISGKVLDKDKQPLTGAAVYVKGSTSSSQATITDFDGNFKLKVASGETPIIISFVGTVSQEILANNLKNATVIMTNQAINIGGEEGVVVTAFGMKKEKKALGYAVQDVGSKELMKNKQDNVVNSLSGKISGVSITQSGGDAGAGSNIVIRGGTSLERDNQPLFVVDGIVYDNGTEIGGNSGFDGALRTSTTYSNRAMDINPEDIESVSVLKGASAAALYGSKASSGVIIITTKKGSEGSVEVNVSSKTNVMWANRFPKIQDKYKRGIYTQTGILDDHTLTSWGEPFEPGDRKYDNISNFFNTGAAYDNNVSISGGSKNNNFYLSASNFTQNGIVPETGYKKTGFRFNGEQKIRNLTVGANVAYSLAKLDKTLTSGGLSGSGGTGAMGSVYSFSPSEDMTHYLNEDGTRYRMFPTQNIADDVDNPYWIINKDNLYDETDRFTGSINLNYKVTDWFNVMYKLGTDTYTTNSHTLIAPGSGVALLYQNGLLTESDLTYNYLSSNFMMNFKKKISDFNFNLLVGQSTEDSKYVTNRRKGYNFIVDNFYSFGNILDANKFLQQSISQKRLIGLYSEFRTDYKDFIFLTLTGRNDWTSTLPINNRSYFYPSVSGSFIFTKFIPENKFLNFGKIRASWAEVGKDASPYATNTYLNPPYDFLGGTGTVNQWTNGNTNLKPEKTRSSEIGLELRTLSGRLNFDYAFYTSETINQIVSPRVSFTTGYIFRSVNAGNISNKGMELTITGKPIVKDNFSWTSTLNLSGNRGRVNNLLEGMDVVYVTDAQVGGAQAASYNNGVFMGISGKKYSRDDFGNIILDWNTGMPTTDGTTTNYIGNREPKLIGGLNNNLQWRNWNLSFLFSFRIGGDVFNGTDSYLTSYGMSERSLERENLTTSGVSKNPSTGDYENVTYTYDANKFYYRGQEVSASTPNAESGRYIIQNYWRNYYSYETANYITKTNWLRLSSLSLTYDFPEEILSKIKVKGLSATLSGSNLLLFTNYKGMDPESSAAGSGVSGSGSSGMDYLGVPSTEGISFGLNLKF